MGSQLRVKGQDGVTTRGQMSGWGQLGVKGQGGITTKGQRSGWGHN